MISLRATADAHALFGEHKQRFLAVGGLAGKQREVEVTDLPQLKSTAKGGALTAPDLADAAAVNQLPLTLQLLKVCCAPKFGCCDITSQ